MSITKSKFLSLQKLTKTKREQLRVQRANLKRILARIVAVDNTIKETLASGIEASNKKVKNLISAKLRMKNTEEATRNKIDNLESQITENIDKLIFSKDPREQVAMLDDQYPVFLTPVRVETRFVTVKHIARIDENKISTTNRKGTITSDDGTDHVPVKSLINGIDELPIIADVKELWVRIFPDDIAVHTHEKELTEIEATAAKKYWDHIWRASDNQSLRIGAWRGLVAGRGPERAAWIASQMTPINGEEQPSVPTKEGDKLLVSPKFPAHELRGDTWTVAPHSRIMPERFVVRLYKSGVYREIIGNNIPDPLHLGIDPQALGDEIQTENGNVYLNDKLKWLQDFDEAESIGMAIRIPINRIENIQGFDKILVLGVKTSANEDEGKKILEDLFENHHFTAGGCSIVPQGTSTNNTEDSDSGYTALNSNETDLFDLEMGDDLFSPTTLDKNKTDGQHLADALGIEYSTVQHIKHADQTDIKEAMCMNKALWPTTFGYYLPQMMHPVFSESDINKTKDHFGKYVLGRGRIPTIRIDDQPYGILPTTAFSKWQYNTNTGNDKFLAGLKRNILDNMDLTWNNLKSKIKTADSSANQANVEKLFVDVLGLHASSVEYYQRYVTGPFLLWNIHNYSSVINSNAADPSNVSYANSFDFFSLFGDQKFVYNFPPRLFDFFYGKDHKFLEGPVIDNAGLSESKLLSSIGAEDENFIDWLMRSGWNEIINEDFSTIGGLSVTPPKSLLYLMLRHSTLLEYARAGHALLSKKGLATSFDYYDTELNNVYGDTQDESIELREMVRAGVLFKEGTKVEKKIERALDKEFEKRELDGSLSKMDMRSVRLARKELKDKMLVDTKEVLFQKAEAEVESVMESQFQSSSKSRQLFEPREDLEGKSVAGIIEDDLKKTKSQSQFDIMHDLQDNLDCLRGMTTAKLERCFAEHIDVANYRLDSWFYSLVLERLQKLRGSGNNRQKGIYIGAYAWLENLRKGTFEAVHYREVDLQSKRILIPEVSNVVVEENIISEFKISGIKSSAFHDEKKKSNQPTISFGYALEDKKISPISEEGEIFEGSSLSGERTLTIDQTTKILKVSSPSNISSINVKKGAPAYSYLGDANDGAGPIVYDVTSDRFINEPRVDSSNQGYIHAPSLNQATTAAVLRAGYETHSLNTGSPDNAMAVNMNSERVRKALFYLEGVNNGQELGALLGYQFERGLHDYDIGLDAFILEIRLKYPFVSGRVTDTSGVASIDSAEAYNVINGLELIENSEDPIADYPYRIDGLPRGGRMRTAIIKEVTKLHEAIDGINDLMMAESMHQVVLGNYPKASAVLSAMGGDPLAINPDIIKTPRRFDVLNHKVGSHFVIKSNGHKMWTTKGTPRSIAEPNLNRWLSNLLPPPDKVEINYQYQMIEENGDPGAVSLESLNLQDLAIEPIDLLYMMNITRDEGASTEFLNVVNYYVRKEIVRDDNLEVNVSYSDKSGITKGSYSIFEIQSLLDQLNHLVGESRTLRPADFLLSGTHDNQIEKNKNKGYNLKSCEDRIINVIGDNMTNGRRGFLGVINDITDGISQAKSVTKDPDTEVIGVLDQLREALHRASMFGIQNASPATATSVTYEISKSLIESGNAVLGAMKEKQEKIDEELANLASAQTDDSKIKVLESLAKLVFGRSFKIFPEYRLYNETELNTALDYEDYLEHAGDDAVQKWMHGITPVRKRMRNFQQVGLLSKALRTDESVLDLTLAQLPLEPKNASLEPQTRWLGVEFPKEYEMPGENVSMLFYDPAEYKSTGLQAGIMIDEWVEEIPHKNVQTGISVHYNNPNSQPPQTCLLAVSPNLDGKWSWDDLMDTLSETLEWAKKRAVDPDLLNETIYPQVLPALYAAVSAPEDTPTLDFGRNGVAKTVNGVFGLIKVKDYAISPFLSELHTDEL